MCKRTLWITGIALVVGAVIGVLRVHHHHGVVVDVVASAVTVGGVAGMFSLFPFHMSRSGDLRSPFLGVGRRRSRAIRRAVIGRHREDPGGLSQDEGERGLAYAEAYRLVQPVNLARSVLLFASLVGTQLLTRDDQTSFAPSLHVLYFAVLPVLLVAGTIATVVRVHRATAFAKAHDDPGLTALPTPQTGR